MTQEETDHYKDIAMKHSNFLCDRIFKPAFEMAFIHGAKHMKEDMMSGDRSAAKPQRKAFDWEIQDNVKENLGTLSRETQREEAKS